MIRISLMNHFVPNGSQYSGDLRAVTKTTHVDPALPGPLSASNTFHFRVGWKWWSIAGRRMTTAEAWARASSTPGRPRTSTSFSSSRRSSRSSSRLRPATNRRRRQLGQVCRQRWRTTFQGKSRWRLDSSEVAYLLLTQQPRFDSCHSQEFSLDVAEIYWWHCLEVRTLDRGLIMSIETHLVLASG